MRTSVSSVTSKFPSAIFGEIGGHNRHCANQSTNEFPQRESSEGISMDSTLGKRSRTFRGDPRVNIADRKKRNQDFLAELASEAPEKVVAEDTGLSPRAVGNLRQRRNKISFDNFTDWCINNPDVFWRFAEHVGAIKPGSAGFAAVMTRIVSEYNKLVPE